jgi:hypothetical protein
MLQLRPSTLENVLAQPTEPQVTERVRGEFREMPGLTLTLAQGRRLWSLDAATCADVLSHLVTTGFLCRRPDGAFRRSSWQNGPR